LNAIVDVPIGLELIAAVAINDTGWIVGTTSQGAFLLAPR